MKFVLHCNQSSPRWHPRYRKALFQGLGNYGQVDWTGEDRVDAGQEDAIHVQFGPNYWSTVDRSASRSICVDRCSVGDANDFVTVGIDGWGGQGLYHAPEDREARWEKWKHLFPPTLNLPQHGDHVVIIGEYPSACDNKEAIDRYYRNVIAEQPHGTKIYFRPHPFHNRSIDGTVLSTDKAVLHTAKRIYTYKSSFGVHCRLLGLPVDAGRSSLAWGLTGSEEEWKKWLLFTQWHISELQTGEFWEHLQQCLKR